MGLGLSMIDLGLCMSSGGFLGSLPLSLGSQDLCTRDELALAQSSHFGSPHCAQKLFDSRFVPHNSYLHISTHLTPNILTNIVMHNNNNIMIPPIENLYAQIMLFDFKLFNWLFIEYISPI